MTTTTPDDEHLKAQVSKELEDAKTLAKTLNFEEVKSGEWFIKLLQQVVRAYDRNARAAYFQKKYPGLSSDEIADILTSVTVRYATIAGAITGVAASANEIAAISSVGLTAALFVGSIGAEMLYLSNIQMRLVLDMSVLYDLHLDVEDPEDILLIFGYALGVAPAEALGKGLQGAARAGTTGAVKKVVSKETLTGPAKICATAWLENYCKRTSSNMRFPLLLPLWEVVTTLLPRSRLGKLPKSISRTGVKRLTN